VVGALIWGGFWAFSSGFPMNMFGGAEPDTGNKVVYSGELDDLPGIFTAVLFGSNEGAIVDLYPVEIMVADYFGTLSEPKETGETGISAAVHFGELMDEKNIVNMFVEYVVILEEMQNLYQVDVYDLLDRTKNRETVLNDYLADLKGIQGEGSEAYRSIKLNIDELTVSYNSLGSDKDKFENDFFMSLELLQPEKSDVLLKSFVDASQKQVALKARVAALKRLSEFYESASLKLDRRISSVEKNMDALVKGIKVVDVPGAGIDLIIHSDT